jgi:catechol 2,3-dioxygenase
MGTDPLDGNDLLEESNGEWSVMPAGTLMGHIHLHVSDLRNTEEFYMQGLGFTVVNRYAGALFTSTGGYHHHIGLNGMVPQLQEKIVFDSMVYLVFANDEARDKVMERLKGIGAVVTEKEEFYVVTDPSGNEIHLVV